MQNSLRHSEGFNPQDPETWSTVLSEMGVLEHSSGETELMVFPNPDGSPRWIWPKGMRNPEFLHFYHLGSWKSRLFASICKLLFALGLGSILARRKYRISNKSAHFKNWVLFTGTAGPNRKAVLRVNSKHAEIVYLKYAIGEQAYKSLSREHGALEKLAAHGAEAFFSFPRISPSKANVFGQENIVQHDSESIVFPNESMCSTMVQWMQNTMHSGAFSGTSIKYDHSRFPVGLVNAVEQIEAWMKLYPPLALVWQHGDFTPWNCRVKGERLQIFDWELLDENGFPLADLFHFVYQQAILVDRCDARQLQERIDQLISRKSVQQFLSLNALRADVLELHYLWHTLSVYLPLYSTQKEWHMQVNWLLETWEQRAHLLLGRVQGNLRSKLLHKIEQAILPLPHAWMKASAESFDKVAPNADIDLCATPETCRQVLLMLGRQAEVKKIRRKFFGKMDQVEVQLIDGSRIDLDFIYSFRRNHLVYLNAANVLSDAKPKRDHGVNEASDFHNAAYTARFYFLNGADIPSKHRFRLELFPQFSNPDKVQAEVLSMPENKGVSNIFNRLAYFIELIRRMQTREKAFVVTFSGVDGAGKSTILENIKQRLEKEHRRRVVVIRHRPSVLPILSAWKYGKKAAEEKSMSQLPRQGKNKNSLSSLFRFGYYLTDYLVGQWVVYLRYTLSGTIVLYDRYYFDFILDSRRSNIHLAPGFVSVFYRFLKKPAFNFFLWAKPEEILKRKQELDSETIVELTNAYTSLFDRLSSSGKLPMYRCIENREIQETSDLILRLLGESTHETGIYPNHSTSKPSV